MLQKMDDAGKNSGVPPKQAAMQISGVPLSRWDLLIGAAPEKKPWPEVQRASAMRIPRKEMEQMLGAFKNNFADDDSRKLRKGIFLFVKHNSDRLHPADALELLLKVVNEDDVHEKRSGQHRLRERAIALAGKRERCFEGMENKGSVVLAFANNGGAVRARVEYRNTPYANFLIKCIASQVQAHAGISPAAMRDEAGYKIECMPFVENAIRSGSAGIQKNILLPLRVLGSMIAGEFAISAFAAWSAIKIVADAMSGAYSVGGLLGTALLGTLALLCGFGIKALRNGAQYELEIMDAAKLGDMLNDCKIAKGDEKGRCI